MDIKTLLNLGRRRSDLPKAPADTLPAITSRLNGGAEDPARVSAALADLLSAKTAWSAHHKDLKEHRRSAVADSADERERRKIRDAIERADEELALLNEAVSPMQLRLAKTQAAARAKTIEDSRRQFALAFERWAVRLGSLATDAHELVKQFENLPAQDGDLQGAVQLCAFIAGWHLERRPGLDSLLLALARKPASATALRPAPAAPKQERPPESLQHAIVVANGREISQAPSAPPGPRLPDADEPLPTGCARVVVVRGGYVGPDGNSCRAGLKLQLPREIAMEAARAGAVEIIEMNIDRTEAAGAEWQTTARPGEPLAPTNIDPQTGNVVRG